MRPVLVLLIDLVLDVDDGRVCSKMRVRVVPANTPAHVPVRLSHLLRECCSDLSCLAGCDRNAQHAASLLLYYKCLSQGRDTSRGAH